MKTAISIPEDVFRSAEALAKRMKVSRSELYRTALREYIGEHAPDDVTERLNRVYEGQDSRLGEAASRIQAASIPPEKW